MEVTRSNFQDVLKELDEVLDKATFLAIDGEFTGLNSGPDANAFDTPAQYYTKLRKGSMNFLLVQFGLAVFTYNSKTNLYSQRSYNFYVFPRPLDRTSPDCRFMCQASSIVFLANEGFDFNKLFKEGIPYLTKEDEEKLNKKMVDKQKVREEGLDLIPISDDDKPQIDEICSGIEDYVNSEDDGKELRIERCNAFIRRLVHQEARLRWPNKIRLETRNENGNQFIIVSKIGTKEEEEQKETERKERVKLEVQEAVGLSVLLRKIADSGKVIVGHNMLLDLCHIIHQFFAPLPESYHEFKSLVHCLFPRLLDTKIICQSGQFKDSVPSNLNQLLETLHSAPFSIPETENIPDRSYKLNNDKSHEAGYDAYITGLCFIALCNRLGELQIPEISTVLPDSPLLNPYLNKLLIARLKDYPHINLIGNDPNPSREHVFHVTFPKQWKLSDLTSLFSPYGGAYVAWLSDTTAYAALHRRDQVSAVVQNLFKSTHYSLKKYRDYQASVEVEETVTKVTTPKTKTTTTTTTKPERKRKISERESPGDEGSAEKAEATGVRPKPEAYAGDEAYMAKRNSRRQHIRQLQQIKKSAMINRDPSGYESFVPRTQRVTKAQIQGMKPEEFAKELIKKLEFVKYERESAERCQRKIKEIDMSISHSDSPCDVPGVHSQSQSQFSSQPQLASQAVPPHQARIFTDTLREKLQLEEDSDQAILDQHVSRVWSDLTPSRSPKLASPRPRSPDKCRRPQQLHQQLGPATPSQQYSGSRASSVAYRNQRKEKDVFSTFSGDSGNVHDFPEAGELHGAGSMSSLGSHLPKSKSVPSDYADSLHKQDLYLQGQDPRYRRLDATRSSATKKSMTELTDSGVSVVSDVSPAIVKKDNRLLNWLKENDSSVGGKGEGNVTTKPVVRKKFNNMPQQPFVGDPGMPLLPQPHIPTQLEEAKRRLEYEQSRNRQRYPTSGSGTKQQQEYDSMPQMPPMQSCPQSNQSTLRRAKQDAPSDFTILVLSFCDEKVPYRIKISGSNVTLKQFKDVLPKKGNYRYFFKTECEDLDMQVIQEEITDDAEVLPLWEGKIMAQVKALE